MLEDHFSRFEDQIQRLVEGGFARLFAGRLHPREVVIQLARAMEDGARTMEDGRLTGPDIYTVRLNPSDHAVILSTDDLEDPAARLADELIEIARTSDISLSAKPEVRLLADANIDVRHISVIAQYANAFTESTQMMPRSLAKEAVETKKAFLLLDNGSRQVPIDQPILNIGRQRNNDVILDVPSISRHHAQIRLRFGHYVLFDMGSSGGTMVNGRPVQEYILQSGDVINLSDYAVIYVEEDISPPSSVSDTQTRIPTDS